MYILIRISLNFVIVHDSGPQILAIGTILDE